MNKEGFLFPGREKRKSAQEQIDTAQLLQIVNDSKRLAADAAEISKKLALLDEGDPEHAALSEKLKKILEEGSELERQKNVLLVRLGAVSVDELGILHDE